MIKYSDKDVCLKVPLPLWDKSKEFNVEEGAYFISCYTLMHRDTEIVSDPMEFKYFRFTKDADGK